MSSSLLNWPGHLDRTPPGERADCSKFSTGFQKTRSQLGDEMDRMGVDEWRLEDVSGSGGDPGVVVRWKKDGNEYAAAADGYTQKGDNIREVYKWVNETRMRETRNVKTAEDNFAAARLPSGENDSDTGVPPHILLEVPPDASDAEVKQAFREKAKEKHSDGGGSTEEMVLLKKAKDRMMGDE